MTQRAGHLVYVVESFLLTVSNGFARAEPIQNLPISQEKGASDFQGRGAQAARMKHPWRCLLAVGLLPSAA